MTIAVRTGEEDAALCYEVFGRLDVDATQEMREIEREAAPDSTVEIDLRACIDMDDYGFGSLVGLIRRAREHHAHVAVVGATQSVREGLRRSGMARLVELRSGSTSSPEPS